MDVVVNQVIEELPSKSCPISGCGHFIHNILSCLNYAHESPPVGDLLKRIHGLDGDWIIATPIRWQATHNDALLTSTVNASTEFFAIFSELMESEGIKTHYHDSNTWLVKIDGKPSIEACPPHIILQKSLMDVLHGIDKTHYWQRIITECQMIFNSQTVNGVWFWGGGVVNPSTRPIVSDDPYLMKIASILSLNIIEYSPSEPTDKKALYIFNKLDNVRRVRLGESAANWHWNNLSYQTKPKWLFSRILGKIKNEN